MTFISSSRLSERCFARKRYESIPDWIGNLVTFYCLRTAPKTILMISEANEDHTIALYWRGSESHFPHPFPGGISLLGRPAAPLLGRLSWSGQSSPLLLGGSHSKLSVQPTRTVMFLLFTIFALVGCCLGQSAFRCPDKNGFYPDPVQCDLYYHCQGGELEEKLCPDGLLFDDSNPKNERCDTNVNVDCGDRTQLQEPKESEGCPRANGFFRHPDSNKCDKFVNCIDGVMNEMPCPPGLIYDDDQSSCVWPTETTRKDCPVTSKRDVLDDGFSCPEGDVMGPNGRTLPHPTYAHPEDCQKFYICRNGVTPQHGSCSAGQVYNEETFKCDDPENVPGCENWFDEDKKKP